MNKVTKSVLILLLRIIVWFALYLIEMVDPKLKELIDD